MVWMEQECDRLMLYLGGVGENVPCYGYDVDLDTVRMVGKFYNICWGGTPPTNLSGFIWGNCITFVGKNPANSIRRIGFQIAFGHPTKMAFRMMEDSYWRNWTILS